MQVAELDSQPASTHGKSAFDVHRLYSGPLAKPLPAALVHLAGLAAVLRLTGPRAGLAAAAALFLAGWAGWTLFEYVLHRWIMHSRNPVLWRVLHKEHHAIRVMDNPDHRTMHPFVGVPVMAGAALLFARLGGAPLLALGFWFGYVFYELIHWVEHDEALTRSLGRLGYFRRIVAAHEAHHLRRANAHYGISTGVWDRVFGTDRKRR